MRGPERRLPPVWVMGLANLPFSITSTIVLITIPQLLAARHVPEPRIAAITAFALIPGFAVLLVAPVLDVRFSRRTYALATALASAALCFTALVRLDDLQALGWLLFAANATSNLFQGALGGWLGSLIPDEEEMRLGAWFTVANIAGFGLDAMLNIVLLRSLPRPWGELCTCALLLAPLMLLAPLPAPGPDRRLARESFLQFARHVERMLRKPAVVRAVLMFATPAACFSLTNMLGGLGGVYHASERFVALAAGVGVTGAGLLGSLLVPRLAGRLGAYRLYLCISGLGSLFTLALLGAPRTAATFALAMVGENVAQAAAFATANVIIFREIGRDNPLAATEFTVLTSAVLLPLTYVQWADGRGYALAGLTGALLTDGLLGLAGAVLVALIQRVPGKEVEDHKQRPAAARADAPACGEATAGRRSRLV